MRALAAVHLPAHLPLGILDGNAALCVADEHDEHNQRQDAHQQQHHQSRVQRTVRGSAAVGPAHHAAVQRADRGGDPGQDAGEQNDGNAVADAELRHLLAHPHDEGGAGDEGHDDDQCGPDAGGIRCQQVVVAHHEIVTDRLQDGDADSGIAGDGLDLLPSLFTAVLGQPLQGRDGHSQQLDDDGCVDIGLDAQGEDRCLGKGAAGHHVVQAQNGAAHLIQIGLQQADIHVRHRDGVADPEDQQDEECKNDLLPQFGDAPRFANGLDHVTSPRPFRLLPR